MGIKIFAENGKLIHIGRIGENLATEVIFDVTQQIAALGEGGQFSLLVSQNNQLTEINLIQNNSFQVEWNVTSDYTAYEGKGKCQIVYKKSLSISKSEIYDFIITFGYKGDE